MTGYQKEEKVMKKIIIGVVGLLALAGIGGAAVIYKKNDSSEETETE